jgi:hypothetical protein
MDANSGEPWFEADISDLKRPDRRNRLAAKAAGGEKVSAKTELKKAKRTDRERELGAKQRACPIRNSV